VSAVLELVLAKAAEGIPGPSAMPGGSRFEPKYDGWRAVVDTRGGRPVIWSRQGTDLTARLPDVWAAAAHQVPPGFVLDGEVVVWSGGRLAFEALQQRMISSRARMSELVRRQPASFVAFDILEVAGQDVRHLPWSARRQLLEELAKDWTPPLQLGLVTADRTVAEDWFEDMAPAGIEGLVVKGAAQHYEPGARSWVKVKRRQSYDVVAGAVLGARSHPAEVVIGLPIDGRLRIVGRTAGLSAVASRALGALLRAPAGAHPWPEVVPPTALARFSKDRTDVHLTLIEPVVVEVLADSAWSGTAFRHSTRFVRVRPELDPGAVAVPD